MMTDAQIAVMVRLNTALSALHEAKQLTVQYGWPDYTEQIDTALSLALAIHKEISKEEE